MIATAFSETVSSRAGAETVASSQALGVIHGVRRGVGHGVGPLHAEYRHEVGAVFSSKTLRQGLSVR
jgi:hypothetical protein